MAKRYNTCMFGGCVEEMIEEDPNGKHKSVIAALKHLHSELESAAAEAHQEAHEYDAMAEEVAEALANEQEEAKFKKRKNGKKKRKK